MEAYSWSDVRDELTSRGATEIRPRQAYDDDVEIAASSMCPHCGRRMAYRGMRRRGTYFAFAVCVPCDVAIEF